MVNKRPKRNSQNSKKCGNGLNCNGNDPKKRKGKQHDQQRLFMSENDYRLRLQEILYSSEHILTKFFRKDGPPLGAQFDSLPSNAFLLDSRNSQHEERWPAHKKRKVPMLAIFDSQVCCEDSSPAVRHGIGKGPMTAKGAPIKKHGMGKGLMTQKAASGKKHGMGKGLMTQKAAPGKKHGMGKGLMTFCRVTNPDATDFPCGVNFSESTVQRKKRMQRQQSIMRILANREKARRKTSLRSRKVECQKVQKQKQPRKEKCELALEDVKCLENSEQFAMLLDDEELELQELQAGPNPLSCSAHFPTDGSHGCSLCKDLLAKFPSNSVTMKPPLPMQPWASLPELVSKLFKVFHFICTYAVTISIYPFTLDEFAQAFHDKDSLLLGQIHLALLKLLLTDIDKEISRGFFSLARKNCKFLGLLHSLERDASVLEFWRKSLNLLTWTEILRQVFIAAGFGSKLGTTPKEGLNKEVNLMEKYGLNPGTLKGELFCILLTQGSGGMKVSELAKSSPIVENLTDTSSDLEDLITSALSGDMTLFEKISSSGYRLRINAAAKECKDCTSDSEDFGSVDDLSEVNIAQNNANDSEYGSRDSSPFEFGQDIYKNQYDTLIVYNEIDESYPGEMWLLGLMEGEYSDLNVEEKLSSLAALIDLLSAGSSIRMEDSLSSTADCPPNINQYCSGAKIKRSATKQCKSPGLLGSRGKQTLNSLDLNASEQPTDSLVPLSKISDEEKYANMKKIAEEMEAEDYLHPMQSIFLGSDRRYNRYWLFLGRCDEFDSGHRRIYFESSDDGHWEVIDTREALCTLLSALDHRGVREARLLASLEKREAFLCQAMSTMQIDVGNEKLALSDQSELNNAREASSSPLSDVDNRSSFSKILNDIPSSTVLNAVEARKKGEQTGKSDLSLAFDACIWKSFYNELYTVKNGKKVYLDSLRRCDYCHDLYWRDEKHCRICHTTFELDFGLEERYAVHSAVCRVSGDANKCQRQRVLSSQLQALKAAIYAIESVVPEEALLGSWKRSAHNLWINRLRRASSLAEFLQVLADFVTAINEDWFYKGNNNTSGSYCIPDYIFSGFSTMPHTFSAVALWLVKLDLLVASHMENSNFQNKSKL